MYRFIKPAVVVGAVSALLLGGLLVATPTWAATTAAAPTITSFTPTSSKLLTPITITGTGFVSPATVRFGGVTASVVTVKSSTKITATLPRTAPSGQITVTTSGGTVTSGGVLTVVPGVSLNPTAGPPTSVVTVKFSGFAPYEAADAYLDSTDTALITTDGNGTANTTLTIPAAASPGAHWISVVGRHSGYAAQASYTVRTDSPTFGFSNTHRGVNVYENALSPGTVGGLHEAWRSVNHKYTLGTPAVVGGVVYDGFGDGSIAAFREATGAQLWKYSTGGVVYSSPTVVGGVLYEGSYDGSVYALNATTGALKWKYATGDGVFSSPVVANGIVYVGSLDHDVYALNATTGAVVWKYATGDAVFSSPAVSGGIVYIGSNDMYLYALNATTGALVWRYQLPGGGAFATPAVADGLVFVGGTNDAMYAIRTSTGTLRWIYQTGSSIQGGAAIANGTVFVGSEDGKEYAFNETNGTLLWSVTAPGGGLISGTTYADGVLYVSDGTTTYALAAATGAALTTLPVGADYGYAVVVDGTVFAADTEDGVYGALTSYALDPSSGNAVRARPDAARLRPTIHT